MALDLVGPCGAWTTLNEVIDRPGLVLSGPGAASDQQITDAITLASDLLYTLSGQQFPGGWDIGAGTSVACARTLRPCASNTCLGFTLPVGDGGYGWVTSTGMHLPDPDSLPLPRCGCFWVPEIDLGYSPVTAVISVKIDGAVIDPATYRVDEFRRLVRLSALDGTGAWTNPGWPRCQYLDRPNTAVGTFEIALQYGQPPPVAGRSAAAALATELAKGASGQPCQFGHRVTSMQRQGVSMTLIDPRMLEQGLTGVWEADLFLQTYNPKGHRGQAMVWSPDLAQAPRRIG